MEWLPQPLLVLDWNAYDASLDRGYRVFCSLYVGKSLHFREKPVRAKRHPELDGKSATFWHLVTEGKQEATRTPVSTRFERLRWPKAIIENADDPSRVVVWQEKTGSEVRWHLALPDFSYLVVLADRGEFVLLWTAFPVEYEHARKKLGRRYSAATKKLGPLA